MHLHYILKYRKPVPCDDLIKWAEWTQKNWRKRRIRKHFIGGLRISTVFLSIDHGIISGEPELFETMIFGNDFETATLFKRYATHREALHGHAEAVAYAKQQREEKKRVQRQKQ